MMSEDDDITFGGFSCKNIRKWLIKECLESGDPQNFFCALQEQVDYIDDCILEDTNYWDNLSENILKE